MAALVCEICGGKLMAKSGGLFECEYCGMQYDKTRIQEMVQEIKGTVQVEGTVEVTGTVKLDGPVEVKGSVNIESFLKRGQLALEDKKWDTAKHFFNEALNLNAECAEAYLGILCAKRRDTRIQNLLMGIYNETYANVLLEDSDFQKAVRFAKPGEFAATLPQRLDEIIRSDLKERSNAAKELPALLKKLAPVQGMIARGGGYSLGLKADGTVVAVGDNKYGQCDVSGWRDIVAIAAGSSHSLGLKSDGTVVAVGDNKYGQCNVSRWRDIVAITAGFDHSLGLKSDGTVVAVGDNEHGQCNVSGWRDIVAISAGSRHSLGLKADGTVVAVGYNDDGQCDVSDWTDIVAISAGWNHSLGLKVDGTVVTVGPRLSGTLDVPRWRNIVAIAGGLWYSLGVLPDGTVAWAGEVSWSVISGWRDIVAISTSSDHFLGLKKDGTVVAGGKNGPGQCNVSTWKLFNSVETLEQEREEAIRARRAEEARIAAERKAEQERLKAARKSELETESTNLRTELANLKGLFTGKRRKEIEARLAAIEAELKNL